VLEHRPDLLKLALDLMAVLGSACGAALATALGEGGHGGSDGAGGGAGLGVDAACYGSNFNSTRMRQEAGPAEVEVTQEAQCIAFSR